jgi:hypothetical protein
MKKIRTSEEINVSNQNEHLVDLEKVEQLDFWLMDKSLLRINALTQLFFTDSPETNFRSNLKQKVNKNVELHMSKLLKREISKKNVIIDSYYKSLKKANSQSSMKLDIFNETEASVHKSKRLLSEKKGIHEEALLELKSCQMQKKLSQRQEKKRKLRDQNFHHIENMNESSVVWICF